MQNEPNLLSEARVALVMSGGSALGAYHAGAYQALHACALEPAWVVGASAGAVNGAVICGNPRERRSEQLQALWRVTPDGHSAEAIAPAADEARRMQAAAQATATGKSDWFVPRAVSSPWWHPSAATEPASLYDLSPLEKRLERLVDFTLLNAGWTRFSATAVDVESGADVAFDTDAHTITARHVRASASLLPAFAPIEVEGRWVGDAGVSANLPLDLVLGAPGEEPLLCIAIDLLPLAAPRPFSMGETLARTQDLIFATQSRRTIAAWQAIYARNARLGDAGTVTLLHLSYTDQEREVSGKAFDFSRLSAQARWNAGYRDMRRAIEGLRGLPPAEPGLQVHALGRAGELEPVSFGLVPIPA